MPRTYVDNAFNRRLGRVGMVVGTAVHSRSSGSLDTYVRTYVDNDMNRRLGRVGLPRGSEPVSSYSPHRWADTYFDIYVDNYKNGCSSQQEDIRGRQHSDQEKFLLSPAPTIKNVTGSSSSSSAKVYVDNSLNRSLGRVGLPVGTAVHSNSPSSSSSSSSAKVYVDNSLNRSLGRVGLPVGTAVHSNSPSSSSSSSSAKVYVDNSLNRSLGRVGLPVGTAVHSNSPSSSSSSSSAKVYVDNSLNRSLGRVGLPVGTAVHSNSPSSSSSSSSAKVYVDNSLNRSLGRVGLPVGTAVHSNSPSSSPSSSSARVYMDNSLNQSLGRVGLRVGTAVHSNSPSSSTHRDTNNSAKQKARNECKDEPASFGKKTTGTASSSTKVEQRASYEKVQDDSNFNGRQDRIGLLPRSRPVRRADLPYQDNAKNRYLGRVGMPKESQTVWKGKFAALRTWLLDEGPSIVPVYNPEEPDVLDHILENHTRLKEVERLMEINNLNFTSSFKLKDFKRNSVTKYIGKIIQYEDMELEKKIGHGDFGAVYLAHYHSTLVAAKIMWQGSVTKKYLKSFESEILRNSQLDHPNIIKYYGPCLEGKNLAIVMEYMDASLWESIHINEEQFTEEEKLKIIHDMTHGLEYLHSVPLFHGNLKTQNVLLDIPVSSKTDGENQPIVAKLCDFGLSGLKSKSETSHSTQPLNRLSVGTTYRYYSPEVLRGEFLTTPKRQQMADIYSVGLVIHELIVEEVPFEDFSMDQLCSQIGYQGIKPFPPFGLNLEKGLEEMLFKCLNFNPNHRPNATQLREMTNSLDAVLIFNLTEE